MYKVGEVTTIIKDQVKRLSIREHQRLLYAPDVLLISFSLPRINRYSCLRNGCSSMVLGGENITR